MNKIDDSWVPFLTEAFKPVEMRRLSEHIKKQRETKKIYPASEDVLRVFSVPLEKVKVVIIGQDPYPHDAADGYAFSSKSGYFPESLSRIFDALEEDYGFVLDPDPDLQRWADQGIFLYNAILTVEQGKPLSHMGLGWEQFSTKVIKYINEKTENTVWLLWGKHGQVFLNLIDPFRHKVILAEHPVAGKYQGNRPWKHNNCFVECNNYLELYGKQPISWGYPS
jgi:uracil-DNA glycosylase